MGEKERKKENEEKMVKKQKNKNKKLPGEARQIAQQLRALATIERTWVQFLAFTWFQRI